MVAIEILTPHSDSISVQTIALSFYVLAQFTSRSDGRRDVKVAMGKAVGFLFNITELPVLKRVGFIYRMYCGRMNSRLGLKRFSLA